MKLNLREPVSPDDQAGLLRILGREKTFSAQQDIIAAGAHNSYSSLIVEGIAARYRLLSNGRRQITALHVPGDFLDLRSFLLKDTEHGVVALTPSRVILADHDALRQLVDTKPSITRLLWMDTTIEAAIYQEWVVSMGRRSSVGRLAHLVCELFTRLRAVRRTDGFTFRLPLTQTELADVLGLSVVHVNRIVKQLRSEFVVSWNNHLVSIQDWQRLREIAEFHPAYLALDPVETINR